MSLVVRQSRRVPGVCSSNTAAVVFLLCLSAGAGDAGAQVSGTLLRCGGPGPAKEASLGIADLVGMAVGTHPSILAKRGEVVAAEADKSSARWQYFPTPSISAGRDSHGVDNSTIAVQQPLWAGGRIDAGMEYANAKAVSADRSVTEAQHTIAVSVTDSYQAWLLAHGRKEAQQRSVMLHEERKASMQRRVASGVSAEVDLDLVASRLAAAKSDLESSESAVRTAMARLSQAVGCTVHEADLRLTEDEVGVESLDAVLANAESSFPLLKRQEADIDAAKQMVGVKRASLSPTLSLRAESVRNSPAAYGAPTSSNDNRIMLVLQFTPGAGLSSFSEVEAAAARVTALRDAREASRRDLHDRVVAEYENYRAASARRTELLYNRKALSQVLDSFSRLFVAGKRSWLDVLNAVRELTQSEVSVSDAEATMIASAYKLRLYSGQFEWYGTPNRMGSRDPG